MTVYVLFGKTGVGKTYIGEFIAEQYDLPHIDGDKFITKEMQYCLEEDEQMTVEMIDAYVNNLIRIIEDFKRQNIGTDLIFTQALYLNKHREQILAEISDSVMVHITVPEPLRFTRITNRYNLFKSKVHVDYAIEMDKHFQPPTHRTIEICNSAKNKCQLKAIIDNEMFDSVIEVEQCGSTESRQHCCVIM